VARKMAAYRHQAVDLAGPDETTVDADCWGVWLLQRVLAVLRRAQHPLHVPRNYVEPGRRGLSRLVAAPKRPVFREKYRQKYRHLTAAAQRGNHKRCEIRIDSLSRSFGSYLPADHAASWPNALRRCSASLPRFFIFWGHSSLRPFTLCRNRQRRSYARTSGKCRAVTRADCV
jgi:hypothetical protein